MFDAIEYEIPFEFIHNKIKIQTIFLIGWCLHQPKCGIDYRVPVGEDTNR